MLGIILICYKNPIEVQKYIEDEIEKVSYPNKIIIVDNSCDDNIYKHLVSITGAIDINNINEVNKCKNIWALNANTNLGYAKANNLGATHLSLHFQLEYLLFSNTDIEIIDGDAITRLIAKLKKLENCSAIGPKVVGIDGKDQSPYNYFPFYQKHILNNLLIPFAKILKNNSIIYTDIVSNAAEGYYYRLIGAFLIVKKHDFVSVGMFDENTFLFCEESILSEKFEKIGKKVYFYPQSQITHFCSLTINKQGAKRKRKFIWESDRYYYSNYRNTSKLLIIVGDFLIWLKGIISNI